MPHAVHQVVAPAAAIDRAGCVVATNAAWDALVPASARGDAVTGAGADYLGVVQRAVADGDPDAARVLELLEALLADEIDHGVVEYPCPTPLDHRWFRVTAQRLVNGEVLLVHARWHAPAPSMGADVPLEGLVHDLANRLHVASGMLTLLEGRGDIATPEQRATWTSTAEDNVQRAMDLLEALQERPEGRLDAPGPRPVVLVDAVATTSRRLGLEVEVDVPGDLVAAVDPDHLDRVLTNLLENAAAYGAPPVSVTARRVDARVQIRVADAGPGIPADVRDRLFTPGTRGVHGDATPGSGLGLSIVRELLRVNAGTIRHVPDEPGTTWVLTLPAAVEVT